MSLDARRILTPRFLQGSSSQSIFNFDQATLAQIKNALLGLPVAGNPFPNATSQQLALALAGSTPWKPWNQSGTIERAIANTVARFATVGGSDQILRSLQIAAGMAGSTAPVTVGTPTKGLALDPVATAAGKAGIAALLGVSAPAASGTATPGAPASSPPGTIAVTTPSGTSNVPVSSVTNPPPGMFPTSQIIQPSPANCDAMNMMIAADGVTCVAKPRGAAPPPVDLNSVLGMTPAIDPSTGLPYAGAAAAPGPSLAGSALATAPVAPPAGAFDFLSAPITLPLVGPVPTWQAAAAALAVGYLAWKRLKRGGSSG